MRAALWLVALFAVAVATALLAGNNQGTVTLFWMPYRVDLSINMVVLLWVLSFAFMHLALRALAALFELPKQARRWRLLQKERAVHAALLDGLAQMMTGRYVRARKSAEQALALESSLQSVERHEDPLPRHLPQLRALAELIAAESAHALRDRAAREAHLQNVIALPATRQLPGMVEAVEAARLSAARWALSDRDAPGALNWLASLPQGVARRTLTLRLRLKATRLMQNNLSALETARLLAKHGAFSDVASQSLLRSLSLACLAECHDRAQFQTAWLALDRDEQEDPEVALQATQRWLSLQGDPRDALQWLLPLWNQWVLSPEGLPEAYRARLADVMEQAFLALPPDTEWLGRIDQARQHLPRHLELQYLSGRVCMRHGLWGKAQQVLERAAPLLTGSILQRRAWSALAELAEQRGDTERAAQAWKKAAQS